MRLATGEWVSIEEETGGEGEGEEGGDAGGVGGAGELVEFAVQDMHEIKLIRRAIHK
jgi:hypothetical protein